MYNFHKLVIAIFRLGFWIARPAPRFSNSPSSISNAATTQSRSPVRGIDTCTVFQATLLTFHRTQTTMSNHTHDTLIVTLAFGNSQLGAKILAKSEPCVNKRVIMRTPEGDEEIGTVSSISGETLLATVDEHYEGHLVARLEALSLGGSVSPVAVANKGTTFEPGEVAADQDDVKASFCSQENASSVDAIHGGDRTYWALHRQEKELSQEGDCRVEGLLHQDD